MWEQSEPVCEYPGKGLRFKTPLRMRTDHRLFFFCGASSLEFHSEPDFPCNQGNETVSLHLGARKKKGQRKKRVGRDRGEWKQGSNGEREGEEKGREGKGAGRKRWMKEEKERRDGGEGRREEGRRGNEAGP